MIDDGAVFLSGTARRLAQYIDSYNRLNGYAPMVREMRDEFGYRQNGSVLHVLGQLERAGVVVRGRGHRQTFVIRHDVFDGGKTAPASRGTELRQDRGRAAAKMMVG
jgi:SOS-response transcriptional repressor LexA